MKPHGPRQNEARRLERIRERIAWSWEGVALSAGELGDRIRDSIEPGGHGRVVAGITLLLVCAAGVFALATSGGGEGEDSEPAAGQDAALAAPGVPPDGKPRYVRKPGFSLALPAGWRRHAPPQGAVFAARSESGLGEATLWIEKDAKLGLRQFERRSLEQLEQLADNARLVDRVKGPSIESSVVELRADAPAGAGATVPYRVTLRGAGPYRLYFSTAVQPGSPPWLRAGAELMHGTLRPEVGPGAGG